jgi:hypothetical protein
MENKGTDDETWMFVHNSTIKRPAFIPNKCCISQKAIKYDFQCLYHTEIINILINKYIYSDLNITNVYMYSNLTW